MKGALLAAVILTQHRFSCFSQVDMFAQRFALVQQRILRQDLFRPKLVTADGSSASGDGRNVTHTITPVESLLGRSGVKFLLGMIVQVLTDSLRFDEEYRQRHLTLFDYFLNRSKKVGTI